MSIRIVLTDNEITINEALNDNETIYEYVNRALNHFENINIVSIYLLIKTDKQMIEIKIK